MTSWLDQTRFTWVVLTIGYGWTRNIVQLEITVFNKKKIKIILLLNIQNTYRNCSLSRNDKYKYLQISCTSSFKTLYFDPSNYACPFVQRNIFQKYWPTIIYFYTVLRHTSLCSSFTTVFINKINDTKVR